MPDPAPEGPTTSIAFSFPAEPSSIPSIRHLIIAEARSLPFTPDELDDIALAISEAFTNLVQHAPHHRVRGTCVLTPTQLEVCFEVDPALRPYLDRWQLPSGLANRGRGIPLLHMLMPIMEVHTRPDGVTELRLVKPVDPTARAA